MNLGKDNIFFSTQLDNLSVNLFISFIWWLFLGLFLMGVVVVAADVMVGITVVGGVTRAVVVPAGVVVITVVVVNMAKNSRY